MRHRDRRQTRAAGALAHEVLLPECEDAGCRRREGRDDVDAIARSEEHFALAVTEVEAADDAALDVRVIEQAVLAADSNQRDLHRVRAVASGETEPEEANGGFASDPQTDRLSGEDIHRLGCGVDRAQ